MKAKKKCPKELGLTSLWKLTSLPTKTYINLLMSKGLLHNQSGNYNVQSRAFSIWVKGLGNRAEFISARPSVWLIGGGHRFYIRLVPQDKGAVDTPIAQFQTKSKRSEHASQHI